MTKLWINDGRNKKNQRFGTIDGEGGNIQDETALFGTKHEYLLLRADEFELGEGQPLDYRRCFDFLSHLPRNRIWSGYFFDYDVTMMCKSMPEERARRLFDPSLRIRPQTARNGDQMAFDCIDVEDWQIGYLPHKEFKVRRIGQDSFTVIADTGTFFQTSFVRTLDKWDIGTEEEREWIAKEKAMRADFTELTDETKAYNMLECILHNQLMEKFRAVCVEIGYVPNKWEGPGHLAGAMLKAHGIPQRDDILIMKNNTFRELANAAYYGGRAETTCIGHVPGPIYQWDINSAYPAALLHLPCLIHGSWKFVRGRPNASTVWVANVRFRHPQQRLLYNLPVRKTDGNIFFPRYGEGHYWSWELLAAEQAGTEFQWINGWVYEKHCQCKPFEWVSGAYMERLRLGKSGKGYALKLGLNSIYGKIAQSIGYAPWANPVWAGLITAWCRAHIIKAYMDNPDDVLMIMTDGMFIRHKPNLPISDKLGEWDVVCHDNLFVVQPGIYFLPGITKTRGVPLGRIQAVEGEFRDAYMGFVRTHQIPPAIPIPVDNFITMRQALARRKWHLAGTWDRTTRDISFDFSTKRSERGVLVEPGGTIRTLPYDEDEKYVSTPYDRMIGGGIIVSPFNRYRDPGLIDRIDEGEQPDWNEPVLGGVE